MTKVLVANSRGIALVIVLWLLVLLVVLASELVVSARGDVGAVRNFKEDRETYFLAYAGVQMALNEILADSDFNYLSEEGVRFARRDDELEWVEFTPRKGIPLGDGIVSYFIEDENRKLNLNRIATNQGILRLLMETLFPEGDVDTETVVDSILDWVDPDDFHRANGAESDYYNSLEPPYNAKNGDFDTLGELKIIKGVTPEIYEALSEVLTVFPVGPPNINTAPGIVLYINGMPPDLVDQTLEQRELNGYVDSNSKSDVFTITSMGRMNGSSLIHRIRAVVRKTISGEMVILDWIDNYYELTPRLETGSNS